MKKAMLVLKDGTCFVGRGFGEEGESAGELVFNTGFCGYQEALTDPSYAGQILTFAYPLIGNYGVNSDDFESDRVWASGVVAREACESPMHMKATETLDGFLKSFGIPGICDVDTRAIVRRIRSYGVMPACLSVYSKKQPRYERLLEMAREVDYGGVDFVDVVACKEKREYAVEGDERVVLIDCGAKRSIIRELMRRGISVTLVPPKTTPEEILSMKPDGVVISNGPGDPALLWYVTGTVRKIMGKLPLFGICLGHQIIALAAGGRTFKMKFGHRGSNHPVKEVESGRVFITSQNHGYAVDERSLPKEFVVTHRNCNDSTVEGMRHEELPVFSVQYHPEANPGPLDSGYLFDRFKELLR